jgi:hypothetical protein
VELAGDLEPAQPVLVGGQFGDGVDQAVHELGHAVDAPGG